MPNIPQNIPVTIVGSYVQPDWLIDREKFHSLAPPRVRAKNIWKIDEEFLEAAQDAATLAAIRDFELAGLDIIGDGEIRRESYSNRFATALDGVNVDVPGVVRGRSGNPLSVPRVVGPIARQRSVQKRDVTFLRSATKKPIKITVPGPFTLAAQVVDEYYGDQEACAMAFADAVNEEIRDLFQAGADIVQLDEPWMEAWPDKADDFGVAAVNRALKGIEGTTAIHLCFGYAFSVKSKPAGYSFLEALNDANVDIVSVEAAQPGLDLSVLKSLASKRIMLGVLDLGDMSVETSDLVASRVRAALKVISRDRLIVAPDCGMKYMPQPVAFRKLESMVAGVEIVRRELGI
jgi:5-methyltetrahydropteroyltriglutamate--homocysteine methyltransferase